MGPGRGCQRLSRCQSRYKVVVGFSLQLRNLKGLSWSAVLPQTAGYKLVALWSPLVYRA